jgi:mitochondrial fission protein ELM1
MVRQQPRLRRLEELLNSYRKSQGCKLIQRENQGRHLIEALKDNEVVGMTVDQGGASGMNASFFGKDASMATGAFRLALKYETVILPAYCARIKGPYLKIIIEQPFEVSKSSDIMQDIQGNLGRLMPIFQRYIEKYPYDYLWSYKIWKYSREKNILILSDGKAGHLRQSQAVAKVLGSCLEAQGKSYAVTTVDVKFKSNFSKSVLVLSSCLSGKYHCQGCLWCLRNFLEAQAYAQLRKARPDFIISCGSALSPINYILSRQYLAKSIVVMRPALLGVNRFNLVIMPWHDQPPKKKNVLVTDGALNIIDDEVLKAHAQRLIAIGGGALRPYPNIGFLIGGDSKKFRLKDKEILEAIAQLKTIATNINADILATTSRRTPAEIEEIVKRELGSCPRCKLLVIANEKNIPEAVAGILGLSQMVVSSCESISMISEAAASKRYVLVFGKDGLSKKHRRFLEHLEQRGHIYLTSADKLSSRMQQLWQDQPASKALMDNIRLEEALGKLL